MDFSVILYNRAVFGPFEAVPIPPNAPPSLTSPVSPSDTSPGRRIPHSRSCSCASPAGGRGSFSE